MKKYLILLVLNLLVISNLFPQCNLNTIGNDFAWCQPCSGSVSSIMTGGVQPYTYNWSTGDTTASVFNLCAGTYTIIASDNNGCVIVDSVTVSQLGTQLQINMTSSAASCSTCCDVCINSNPSGGCVPYSYSWQPNDPNWPPCSGCPFLNYIVTITDACGCFLTDSITTDTNAVGTGINNIYQKDNLSIYPNPSNNLLAIKLSTATESFYAVIIDTYGNTIMKVNLKLKENIISTNELVAGLYFIVILNDKQILKTEKWVKIP